MTLEESLIEHCAPTLAGIKMASLYRFFPEDQRVFAQRFKMLRERLSHLGLELKVLKGCRRTGSYLIYLYRRSDLERRLGEPETRLYLEALRYDTGAGQAALLRQLTGRLCLEKEFPHEIGVFLGYPLEDIKGFVENKGKNYTCCGCWKSYGDPRAARRCFSSYRVCTAIYKRRYADGTPITQLIVAA